MPFWFKIRKKYKIKSLVLLQHPATSSWFNSWTKNNLLIVMYCNNHSPPCGAPALKAGEM
jgi:hypothetical protein